MTTSTGSMSAGPARAATSVARRINIGCGMTPTLGWENYDNSLTVRLAKVPGLARVVTHVRFVPIAQRKYFEWLACNQIRYGNALAIPEADSSVDVVYSSHMLEHLDRDDAVRFLKEAYRVLRPGGVVRLAVPDLRILAERYLCTGDSDEFMAALDLVRPKCRSFGGYAYRLVAGWRGHRWMYDAVSLCRLLTAMDFEDPRGVPAGTTTIADPGGLDLAERKNVSIYVEANKPRAGERGDGSLM